MSDLYEYIHTQENEPRFNMPYTPAIKATGGQIVYLAGVTQVGDGGRRRGAGRHHRADPLHGRPGDNQDGVNRAMARHLGDHRPANTSVEVVRLATDPRLILELKAVAVIPH